MRSAPALSVAMLLATPWAAAQERIGIVIDGPRCRVSTPEHCHTPEDRQKLAREQAVADRQEAERKRQAALREAAVKAEMDRLGLPPHRRAEAERLVEMRRAADAARARSVPASAGATAAGTPAGTPAGPSAADAAQDAARRKREAAELARKERERAQEEARKKHEEDLARHLAAERSGIRLRALTCAGQETVTGTRPPVSPRIANCIVVHYEARCPGVPTGQGISMSFYNFVGGNSCYGDTQRLPRPLGCKPESAIVTVRSVTTCNN